jgi:mevalonate pyrophosphate decarboxylase
MVNDTDEHSEDGIGIVQDSCKKNPRTEHHHDRTRSSYFFDYRIEHASNGKLESDSLELLSPHVQVALQVV